MIYYGQFRNINDELFTVRFTVNNGSTTQTEIKLGGTPCIITQESSELFQPVKSQRCTVQIVSDDLLDNLYTDQIHGVKCEVLKHGSNNTTSTVFLGWVTPMAYNQNWAYLDTFEIESVGMLSTLDDFEYTPVSGTEDVRTVGQIIQHLLTVAGYTTTTQIHIPNKISLSGSYDLFYNMRLSESNFFDNDDTHTPWSCREVLEQICTYLGCTCLSFEDKIYFVDYQSNAYSTNCVSSFYRKTLGNFNSSTTTTVTYPRTTLLPSSVFGDDGNLSFEETFNKFEISANMYDIDEICPDILDSKNIKNLSGYPNETTWTTTEYKWNGKVKDQYTTFYEYQTLACANEATGWTHHYYKMSNGTELSSHYDSSSTSQYNRYISPRANTRCALIQRYTYYDADDPTPAALSWNNFITFFCLDDTVPTTSRTLHNTTITGILVNESTDLLEQPVLTYTSRDAIRFSPRTGKSWITFKGDLWYQCNAKGDKTNTNIVNESGHYYTFSPTENVTSTDPFRYSVSATGKWGNWFSGGSTTYSATFPSRTKTNSQYGKGFPLLKAKLKIGNKYWNGSQWTTTSSTFYINYNNSPRNGDEETVKCFEWCSVAPNYDYTSKLEDGYWAIPISPSDNVDGVLEFTLYTPSQLKPLLTDKWYYPIDWKILFPVIFMKDFELGYAYTGNKAWYLEQDKDENDLVYTHTVEDGYLREHKGIELKINTIQTDTPISKSFALTTSGFVTTLYNSITGHSERPENLLIEKLYNHYHDKKMIYEATYKQHPLPSQIYSFTSGLEVPGNYIVDSYEWDVANDCSKTKYIEF